MPNINFPNSPSVDQTYTFNGKTWKWNGSAWELVASGTWNININGTVGATTPYSGAFTTLTTTGNAGVGTTSTNPNNFARSFVVSAATSGDSVGGITIQGSRTANGDNFGSFDFYHQSNRVAAVTSARGVNANDGSMLFWTASAGSLTEKVRIDNNGNVGVGVTPSAFDTSGIGAAVQLKNVSIYGYNNNDLHLSSNAYWNGSNWKYIASSVAASNYYQVGGEHVWRNASSGTAGNNITWSDRMKIDASGNVGIGTSSPIVISNQTSCTVNGTNVGRFDVRVGGTHVAQYLATSTDVQIGSIANIPVLFYANSTERMRIDTSGNVVVGTAALATSATAGFPWIPSCAGTPTGSPTAPYTNAAALVVDTTNNNLDVRVGSSWMAINAVPAANFKASLTDSTARTYTAGSWYSLGTTSNAITDNSIVAMRLYVQVDGDGWHSAIGGVIAGLCQWKYDGTLAEWSCLLDAHINTYSGITATIRRDAGNGSGTFSVKFSSSITVSSGGFVRLDILRLL